MQSEIIKNCSANFNSLLSCSYRFVVSFQRQTREFKLTFAEKDFFHLAGFQYFTDISIPKNKKETLKNCLNEIITDEKLKKSRAYTEDAKSRITELAHLEQYLDTNNIIRIFIPCETGSQIRAEYVIESRISPDGPSVYLFLTERKPATQEYCIVSFFCKGQKNYGGSNLYWMLKEKFKDGQYTLLYKNPRYAIAETPDSD